MGGDLRLELRSRGRGRGDVIGDVSGARRHQEGDDGERDEGGQHAEQEGARGVGPGAAGRPHLRRRRRGEGAARTPTAPGRRPSGTP